MGTRSLHLLYALAPLVALAACSDDNDNRRDAGTGTGADASGRYDTGSVTDASADTNPRDAAMTTDGTVTTEAGVADAPVVDAPVVDAAIAVDGAGRDTSVGETSTGETGTGSDGAAELGNAQIATIVMTANGGEVAAANLALAKAQAAPVTAFAQMMTDEHGASQAQAQTMAATKGWTVVTSPDNDKLAADAGAALAQLTAAPTDTFDLAYVQSQVTMHQQVLLLLDSKLVPSATDPELRALLAATRATVSEHLTRAQQLLAALMVSP